MTLGLKVILLCAGFLCISIVLGLFGKRLSDDLSRRVDLNVLTPTAPRENPGRALRALTYGLLGGG